MRRGGEEHGECRQVHVGHGTAGGSADVEFVEFNVLRNECVAARHDTAAPNMYHREQPNANTITKEAVALRFNIVLHGLGVLQHLE